MAHSFEEAFAAAGLATTSDRYHPAPAAPEEPASAGPQGRRPHWLTHRTVGISRHAVERFRERFSPDLNHADAHTQLAVLLYETGSVEFIPDSRPDPQHPRENRNRGYLVVDHDMVLPLKESRDLPDAQGHLPRQAHYVVTCLNRWYWEENWVPPSRPHPSGGTSF